MKQSRFSLSLHSMFLILQYHHIHGTPSTSFPLPPLTPPNTHLLHHPLNHPPPYHYHPLLPLPPLTPSYPTTHLLPPLTPSYPTHLSHNSPPQTTYLHSPPPTPTHLSHNSPPPTMTYLVYRVWAVHQPF